MGVPILELLALVVVIVVPVLILAEIITVLIYVLGFVLRISEEKGLIQKAKAQNDRIFDASAKAVIEACEPVEAVLRSFENPQEELPQQTIGENLYSRMTASRQVLMQHGIIRRLRFVCVNSENNNTGKVFRRWDMGGKEWKACELSAAALEECIEQASGRVLSSTFYYSVRIDFSMSRRLTSTDKSRQTQKDKWGKRVVKTDKFYEGQQITNCPSCGAPLPEGTKDVVCQYCGSTIFADYYDWQLESFEMEPKRTKFRGAIWWIVHFCTDRKNASRVKNKNKEKIVRFSENDFRQDVYESLMESEKEPGLVDLWIGEIEIRKIMNTENETILDTEVPMYKITVQNTGAGAIVNNSTKILRRNYKRMRYPDRFRKQGATISGEKYCPSCCAPFTPDEKGNCVHCGAFLFRDSVKWKPETGT